MKHLLTLLACAAALALSAATTQAADSKDETELKGEGLCLKCALKKADKCTNAVRVKGKDGKETIYTLDDNDVSKAFHKNVCSGPQKVVAKGKVKKDGDKHILVASKIEVASDKK